jgi:hypothetical protein
VVHSWEVGDTPVALDNTGSRIFIFDGRSSTYAMTVFSCFSSALATSLIFFSSLSIFSRTLSSTKPFLVIVSVEYLIYRG